MENMENTAARRLYTHPAPEQTVAAFIPAASARLAADRLHAQARLEETSAAGNTLLASAFSVAGHALHRAGWAPTPEPDHYADDEERTSIYLPDRAVTALLEARGWTVEPIAGGGNAYVRPGARRRAAGGQFGTDYLWHPDEALTSALEAEAAAAGA